MAKIMVKELFEKYLNLEIDTDKFLFELNNNKLYFEELQKIINDYKEKELDEFFVNYSRPYMLEFRVRREYSEDLNNGLKEIIDKYNATIDDSFLQDETITKIQNESYDYIKNNYKNISSLFTQERLSRSARNVYNGTVSAFKDDLCYDTTAQLYQSLWGNITNKNYEYSLRSYLINDTVLDKIVGGNNIEIDNYILENILIPTMNIATGNPSLKEYNKRLRKVKTLIKEYFPSQVPYSKVDWDFHGRWQFVNGKPATLISINRGVYKFDK